MRLSSEEHEVAVASAAFAREVDDPEVLAVLYDAVGGFDFGSEADGWTALDVAVAASGGSKGEARRLIGQGGFRINGRQLTDPEAHAALRARGRQRPRDTVPRSRVPPRRGRIRPRRRAGSARPEAVPR